MSLQGWKALVASPRFQKNQGRDYVFYESHPGFVHGQSHNDALRNALHWGIDDKAACIFLHFTYKS